MPHELMHRSAFEQMGETKARVLAQQGGEAAAEATAWLAELAASREAAATSKRDTREEETLSIARAANRIASDALASSRRANKIAIIAIAFASATAIITAVVGVMFTSAK